MKLSTLFLVLLTILAGNAGAAGERWADRLNAAEGETLLWLEADVVPEESPAAEPAPTAGAAAEPSPATSPGPAQATPAASPTPSPTESLSPSPSPSPDTGAESPPKDRFAALALPFLTPQPEGGVILIHDRGGHPDWPGVIAPLRRSLPNHGWATLSIEYPNGTPGFERRIARAVKRIEAALRFYNERQLFNVVLVGHGEGALAAAAYLADNPRSGISGFVAASLPTPPASVGGLVLLEGIQVPMLELYGERDRFEVVDGARERSRAVLRGGNAQYRQRLVAGADHFFSAMEPTLVEAVRRWLKRYCSGKKMELSSLEGRAIRKSLGRVDASPAADDGAPPVEEGSKPLPDDAP